MFVISFLTSRLTYWGVFFFLIDLDRKQPRITPTVLFSFNLLVFFIPGFLFFLPKLLKQLKNIFVYLVVLIVKLDIIRSKFFMETLIIKKLIMVILFYTLSNQKFL